MYHRQKLKFEQIQQFLNLSYQATRNHIKRRKWHELKDNYGQKWFDVPVEELKSIAEKSAKRGKNKQETKSKQLGKFEEVSHTFEKLIQTEKDEKEGIKVQLENKTKQNEELTKQLTTEKVDKQKLLGELEKSKVELGYSQKQNQESLSKIDKLNQELKLANRSWWRKILKVP